MAKPKSRRFAARSSADFGDLLSKEFYAPVQSDAWVAITDVVSSTQAIQDGRYKDVNLAGAAGIAAFANLAPDWDLPAAFGGDGAIIIIPAHLRDAARQTLAGLHAICQQALGLVLRTALFPVEEIRRRNTDVLLAYHELKGGRHLAMLAGGGVALAEALSKSPDAQAFLVQPDPSAPTPNLEGLSCRWQPIRPERGLMLSLVIDAGGDPLAYRPLFDAIALAAAGPQSPLSKAVPGMAWPPKTWRLELALTPSKPLLAGAASLLTASAVGALSTWTGQSIGGFSGRAYRASLATHCDAMKFADSLRMVIDCSPDEADAVESVLTDLQHDSGFAFGTQRSKAALMTCLVEHTDDGRHLHFIDGADGGYAVASQALKSRRTMPSNR